MKRILFTVLNWGLGHAVRSFPLIRHLLDNGHEVVIGSDGDAGLMLKQQFPRAKYLELPGYHISYKTSSLLRNMFSQLPGILNAIRSEHHFVLKAHEKQNFDLVISDNRYGCHIQGVKSILISHQLRISPGIANLGLRNFVNKFDLLWIPDLQNRMLSDNLSKSAYGSTSIEIKFIGLLSELQKIEVEKNYSGIAILSGPEPARSIFQKKLLDQMFHLPDQSFMMIGGTPMAGSELEQIENVTFQPFADRSALAKILSRSDTVICRSGYTSLMDYLKLGKHMILIPTPGQPEQIQLARNLKKNNWAVVQAESELDLGFALKELDSIEIPQMEDSWYQQFRDKMDDSLSS